MNDVADGESAAQEWRSIFVFPKQLMKKCFRSHLFESIGNHFSMCSSGGNTCKGVAKFEHTVPAMINVY